jgi:hypothetical protein
MKINLDRTGKCYDEEKKKALLEGELDKVDPKEERGGRKEEVRET